MSEGQSTTRTPIEVTVKYATTADDLEGAWSFVMDRLDQVGPDPSILIKPIWSKGYDQVGDDEPWPRHFEVVVEGMVEES